MITMMIVIIENDKWTKLILSAFAFSNKEIKLNSSMGIMNK